ncbi:MAG TPA: YncE family protein [Steroidobacteraceae bacterium]
MAVSVPAVAGALPFGIAHRIELAGGSPVAALAFAADGKLAYAAAGDELQGFEVATGAPAALVKSPGTVVALASSPEAGGTLYAAVGTPARLLFLSQRPLRVRSSVAVRGGPPSGLLYEPGEHALYVESRVGRSVTRLDSRSGKAIAVAHLQGAPAQMAGDGRGTLYVANTATDAIDVIDTDKMMGIGAIPTPDCHAPTGLAVDPVGRRLFVACGNGTALVIDTDMGFAFEQLPIQKAQAQRTVFAFHPGGPGGWKGGAFIAGDGPGLDAIRMNAFISYASGGSMPLSGRVTAMAVSPSAEQLWIAIAPREGSGATGSAAAVGESRQESAVHILALAGSGGGAP